MSDEFQSNAMLESPLDLEGVDAVPMPAPIAGAPMPVAPLDELDIAPVSAADMEAVVPVAAPVVAKPLSVAVPTPESVTPVVAPVTPVSEVVGASEDRGSTPEMVVTATADPTIVSIAEIQSSKPAFASKAMAGLSSVLSVFQGRAWLAGVLLAVVLSVFLFIPPISIAQRLSAGGAYATLDVSNPAVEHEDGITVSLEEDATTKMRVKLDSVPRADFVAQTADDDTLSAALAALPPHLEPKSPYYDLAIRGKVRGPATVDILIPNESEPWETLDLYTWDAETKKWRWIPSRLDRDAEVLVAEVASLPDSVMVMQSQLVEQKIATESDSLVLNGAEVVLTHVDVPGMLIGTLGGLTGDAARLPRAAQEGNLAVVPVVRNWVPGREANWALVSEMLGNAADHQKHVESLLGLTQSGGYPGLILDYRAVALDDREAYAAFVAVAAAAFHENGLWLGVVVDSPQLAADGSWDTGGYDWAVIGAAVDQVRVLMPLDPQAYTPGGAAQQLIAWAVTRVERYKLIPIFSTLSTDGTNVLTIDNVLAAVGNIASTTKITDSVEPGITLNFQLGTTVMIESDAGTGATRVVAGSDMYWLGSAQWLRARLDLVAQYHLGGAFLRNVLDEGNATNLIPAIADYQAQIKSPVYALPEVAWEVTSPDGKTTQVTTALTESQFSWTTPEVTGTYSIAARVAGLSKGALSVAVAAPRPVLTETLISESDEVDADGNKSISADPSDEIETTDDDPTEDPTEEAEVLKAAFVTDVTIPDYTQFEKGKAFVKTWRLQNAGNVAWPEDTVLVFAKGEQMGGASPVTVGEVAPGDSVDISVDLTAPDADGTFKATWFLQAGGKDIAGGGVFLVIKAGEEAAAPAPAPAPIAGGGLGGGFELGGHVRDMGLPYAEKMHYSGMNWAKVQVHYGADAAWMVNAAHAAGFKIQLSALGGAGMVVEEGFESKFAGWVAGLAAAGADAIEIWNEPNIDREWQIGHISPQAYTNLLCASYNAIKAANGGSAVISAAPAPTGWFGGCGPNGCDDQPWMEGLRNAGAANCMDYIGAHHNAGATAPSARSGHPAGGTHHSWYFLPQTELYYNIFGGARQLFYTEMGYASQEGVPTFSDQFAWARNINNAQQAAWLAEAVQLGINTGMVRCIIVWNIDFVRYGTDPQDGFAIIRPGGGCAACESLHNVLGNR